jgi:hypothetical protein
MPGYFRATAALGLPKTKLRGRGEVFRREVFGQKLRPSCGGDHGGVVSRERQRWEGDWQSTPVGLCLEAAAKLAVCRYTAGYDDATSSEGLCRSEGLAKKIADYSVSE